MSYSAAGGNENSTSAGSHYGLLGAVAPSDGECGSTPICSCWSTSTRRSRSAEATEGTEEAGSHGETEERRSVRLAKE